MCPHYALLATHQHLPHVLQTGQSWTCLLDGKEARQSFPPDYLHAVEPPPADAPILTAFQPKLLEGSLPADEIPSYLHGLQHDADVPVDLRRERPGCELWYQVLTGSDSLADLMDDELCSLHYLQGKTATLLTTA